MATKIRPRPCLAKCGRFVTGRERLCADCVSYCECGNRKQTDRPRCRNCASRTATSSQRAGCGMGAAIEWVPNGRGIVVAKR
ncbi:MAG TPA: hypothetical protein VIQ30_00200 [Pseudonocardia sp.]